MSTQKWLEQYGGKKSTTFLENMAKSATSQADKDAIKSIIQQRESIPKQSNPNSVSMYDEKGNHSSVNRNYAQQKIRNEGFTYDKPQNTTYYDPQGGGFTHTINAKYWEDEFAKKGYVKDQNNSFGELMKQAQAGQLTADQLKAAIAKIHQNNTALNPTQTPKVVAPNPTALSSTSTPTGYTPTSYTPTSGGGGGGGGYFPSTGGGGLDNSGLINTQYASLTNALKAKIQQSINNKNMEIGQLGQKYQPMKNESEVAKAQQLRSVLEQNANAGDRGGVGRQNALETQTAGENRLNNINLQQGNEETELRNAIANLTLEGNVQEAQLMAQKLKDLIANNQYVDQTRYNRNRDALEFGYRANRDNITDQRYLDEMAWQRNPDNPAVRAQNLANLMNELKLSSLPEQIRNQATLMEQQLRSGELSLAEAEYNLQQIQDPNSPINVAQRLELEMKQLEAQYAEPMMKAELARIKKQIADIGRAPYRSPEQVEMDKLRLEQAKLELEAMKNPQADPYQAEAQALSQLTPKEAYQLLLDNAQQYIQTLGIEKYNKLKNAYKSAAESELY